MLTSVSSTLFIINDLSFLIKVQSVFSNFIFCTVLPHCYFRIFSCSWIQHVTLRVYSVYFSHILTKLVISSGRDWFLRRKDWWLKTWSVYPEDTLCHSWTGECLCRKEQPLLTNNTNKEGIGRNFRWVIGIGMWCGYAWTLSDDSSDFSKNRDWSEYFPCHVICKLCLHCLWLFIYF